VRSTTARITRPITLLLLTARTLPLLRRLLAARLAAILLDTAVPILSTAAATAIPAAAAITLIPRTRVAIPIASGITARSA
jgi:hypothetical protein